MSTEPVRWWQHLWRRPGRSVLVLALLALTGMGLYTAYATILVPQYHLRQARQALQRRDLEAARQSLEVCVEAWPASVEVRLLAARAHRLAERYDEADRHLRFAQKLLQDRPNDALQLERDLLQVQRGQLGPVEFQFYRLIGEQHPDRFLILEALAEGYRKAVRYQDALTCLDLWLKEQPESVPALIKRGVIWENLLNFEEAGKDFRRAVERDPENRTAIRLLARSLVDYQERPDLALGYFRKLYDAQPDNPEWARGLARCLRHAGQPDEARSVLDRALAEHPRNGLLLRERGQLALELDRVAEAEKWLRQAAEVLPSDYTTLFGIHECLQRGGRPEEARRFKAEVDRLHADIQRLQQLRVAMLDSPHDPALLCETGQILLRQGNIEQGLEWLQAALRKDPNYQPARQALADYQQTGKVPAPPAGKGG